MKKLGFLLLVFSLLLVSGCTNTNDVSSPKEELPKYDSKIPEDLGKTLDNRWEITNSSGEKLDLAADAINSELKDLEKYQDLEIGNYENTDYYLKMNSYIHELNRGLLYIKGLQLGVNTQSNIEGWNDHQIQRSKILNEINEIAPIAVSEGNEELLKTVLDYGKEAYENGKEVEILKEKLKEKKVSFDEVSFDDDNNLIIQLENIAPLNGNEFLTSFCDNVRSIAPLVKNINFSNILIQRKINTRDESYIMPGTLILYEKDNFNALNDSDDLFIFKNADAYKIFNNILEDSDDFKSLPGVKKGSAAYDIFNYYSGFSEPNK